MRDLSSSLLNTLWKQSMIVVVKKSVIVSMVMVAVFIGCGGSVEVPGLNLRSALDQALVEKFGEDDELVYLKSEITLSDN